jgi:putative ABC transport system permease protein
VTGIAGISPEVRATVQVVAGNQNTSVGIWGVSADFADIRSWKFQSGENFTDTDVRNAGKVCLMGKTTAASLFGEGIDPVGQTVSIKDSPVAVVGWLASKGANTFGQDQDDIIIMPYTSVMKRLSGDTKFRAFSAAATGQDVMGDVTNQVAAILRQNHQITEDKEDDFSIRSQQEMSDFFNANNRVMTILISAFAGISLVVGGIGIMNIMLVSVTERTREIGIRLAVGARARDVLRQFLIEAVLLSMVGGGLGILAGYWLAPLLTKFAGFPTLISSQSVLIAFSVSAVIGVVFGFFPALKAANLDPIEALRYE